MSRKRQRLVACSESPDWCLAAPRPGRNRPLPDHCPPGYPTPTGPAAPRRSRARLAVLLATICLVLGMTQELGAETVSRELFGLHVHGIPYGGEWPDTEFGFLRLWDAGVIWRDVEPEKGEWDFELLDRYVEEAGQHDVQILLTLGQPPQWAAQDPEAPSPYGEGASSPPHSLDDWRDYVEILAKRYEGRIHAWEIWNEISVEHFYSGDFERLVEMERVAAEALKSVDQDNVVLTPSVHGGAYTELNEYFEEGGGRYADVISYHFYAPAETPEAVPERIRRVREIMDRHGLGDKPLWNTEVGWLIPNRDGGFGDRYETREEWHGWRKTDPKEAAGFVVRNYLHNLNGGVRHVFWYSWDSDAMGLAEIGSQEYKPAAEAYVRAREWLVGASFDGCSKESGGLWGDDIWQCRLERDGTEQWVIWSPREQTFDIPPDWDVATMQGLLDHDKQELRGQTIDVGPLPVLLSR